MSQTQPRLQKNKWGVFQYTPLPSEQELEAYYSDKYYQVGLGSYATEYDEEELQWRRVRAELITMLAEKHLPGTKGRVLDVGCGEGWLLNAFHSRRYTVTGFDFSIAGIRKWHPHLLPHFSQGNVYGLLGEEIKKKEVYDLIFLGNVIEHVVNPEQLVDSLRTLLAPSGLLIIVAPNDFSDLQETILDKGLADAPWWLGYPDHLSYFNIEAMRTFATAMGYTILTTMGDFPMEFSLFSGQSNYVRDRSLGPDAHRRRMRTDNYLFDTSPEVLLAIYEKLGSVGVGRNLIYYCTRNDAL